MRFKAEQPSLSVHVPAKPDIRFRDGIYETDDPAEIEALSRAKGVTQDKRSCDNQEEPSPRPKSNKPKAKSRRKKAVKKPRRK